MRILGAPKQGCTPDMAKIVALAADYGLQFGEPPLLPDVFHATGCRQRSHESAARLGTVLAREPNSMNTKPSGLGC